MKQYSLPRIVNLLIGLYLVVVCIEVYGEYVRQETIIWFAKPLLMPLLLLVYVSMAGRVNWTLVTALGCAWVANLNFIIATHTQIGVGVFAFLVYRILVFAIVIKMFRWPGWLPVLIGALPVAFLFMGLVYPIADAGDGQVFVALGQGLLVSIFCGVCIAVWVMYPSKASSMLLVSTLLMASAAFFNQIKIFYISLPMLQPLGMFMYAIGQLLLVGFIIAAERNPTVIRPMISKRR